MPLSDIFTCFKKAAGDAAEQYGGAGARDLVNDGFDQINVDETEAGLGDLVQSFTGKQTGGLQNLLSTLAGSMSGMEGRASEKGMDPSLIQAVMGMLSGSGGDSGGGLNMASLMKVASSLTKGGSGGGGGLGGFMSLLGGGGGSGGEGGGANVGSIMQILMGLAKSFFAMQMGKNKAMQDWGSAGADKNKNDDNVGKWADNIIGDLVNPGKKQKDIVKDGDDKNDPSDKTANDDDVKGWFDGHPEIGKMQKDVFDDIFDTTDDDDDAKADDDAPLIPTPVGFEQDCSVLDHTSIMFLNSKILLELRKEWRFLYSSQTHDKSFSGMVNRIQYQGPTLMIIKTTSDVILGAFASTSWARTNGGWTGNGDSFLFSLNPKMSIFYSTGQDENFMYLDDSNGLGLGGKITSFALGLDTSMDTLSYREDANTFDLPPLEQGDSFDIEHIEVWGLGKQVDANEEQSKVSVRKPNLQIKGGNVDMNDLLGQIG